MKRTSDRATTDGVRKALRQIAEAESPTKPLTDAGMKKMIPLYVESGKHKSTDHRCKNCMMRIESGKDESYCTIVESPISLSRGTCSYWAEGPASSINKTHDERMDHETASYVDVDPSVPVNCSTCKHYDKGYCALWMGRAKPADCCMAWDNPKATKKG